MAPPPLVYFDYWGWINKDSSSSFNGKFYMKVFQYVQTLLNTYKICCIFWPSHCKEVYQSWTQYIRKLNANKQSFTYGSHTLQHYICARSNLFIVYYFSTVYYFPVTCDTSLIKNKTNTNQKTNKINTKIQLSWLSTIFGTHNIRIQLSFVKHLWHFLNFDLL